MFRWNYRESTRSDDCVEKPRATDSCVPGMVRLSTKWSQYRNAVVSARIKSWETNLFGNDFILGRRRNCDRVEISGRDEPRESLS